MGHFLVRGAVVYAVCSTFSFLRALTNVVMVCTLLVRRASLLSEANDASRREPVDLWMKKGNIDFTERHNNYISPFQL